MLKNNWILVRKQEKPKKDILKIFKSQAYLGGNTLFTDMLPSSVKFFFKIELIIKFCSIFFGIINEFFFNYLSIQWKQENFNEVKNKIKWKIYSRIYKKKKIKKKKNDFYYYKNKQLVDFKVYLDKFGEFKIIVFMHKWLKKKIIYINPFDYVYDEDELGFNIKKIRLKPGFQNYLLNSKFHFYLNLYIFLNEYIEYFAFVKRIDSFNEFLFNFYNFREKTYNIVKKKYVNRGYKLKKIGIYIRSFLKNNKRIDAPASISCLLLMRFKKKNLFLTLLNTQGNVLCKTNLGSCGFKKKVKYTGYAIKNTSRSFSKKVMRAFIYTVFTVRKQCEKHMEKIHNLISLRQKINLLNERFNNLSLFLEKKKYIYKFCSSSFKLWVNKLSNKSILRTKIKKNLIFNKFFKYRKYPHFRKAIQKSFKINVRLTSNFKFWGFKFVMYGIQRYFRWFNNLEFRMPVPHSKGLRLRKKRRI